jgi:small GTP-binding protein
MATPTTAAQPKVRIARPMQSLSTEYDVLAKAIIIGDSSVGKSSLLYRYTEQDWNPHYIATIGVDFKVMTFERDSKVIKLQLWDTAGQDRFRTIVHTYYRGAHGVMLVFALDDRASFDNLQEWLGDVQKFASNGVPIVLVGNKADCPRDQVTVSDEEAEHLATQLGGTYVKTSARQNIGVDEAFTVTLERCLAHRLEILAKQRPDGPGPAPVRLPKKKPADGSRKFSCPCS